MAAEVQTAAYAYTPAWHGLGNVLAKAPNSAEMIEAAGLDWHVSLRRITVDGGIDGEDHRATVRDDTGKLLGIVKDGYGVVQNRDAFNFLDDLIKDRVMKYESAMSLRGGRIIVVLARMPDIDEIADGDKSHRYVMFQTSHDGSMKLHAIPTSVRVVCMNTLRMAIQGMEGVRHIGDMGKKLDYLHKYLSQFNKQFTDYRDNARRLAEAPVSPTKAKEYIDALFPPVKDEGKAHTQRENRVALVRSAYVKPANSMPSIKGTWWALLNSVTEVVDHASTFKGQGRTRQENRYLSIVEGDKAEFKLKALKFAMDAAAGRKLVVPV